MKNAVLDNGEKSEHHRKMIRGSEADAGDKGDDQKDEVLSNKYQKRAVPEEELKEDKGVAYSIREGEEEESAGGSLSDICINELNNQLDRDARKNKKIKQLISLSNTDLTATTTLK